MSLNDSVVISVVIPLKDSLPEIGGPLGELFGVLSGHWRFFEIVLIDSCVAPSPGIQAFLQEYSNIRYYIIDSDSSPDIDILAGLDTTIGDFVVTMRLGIDPPRMIPELIEKACRIDAPLLGVVATDQDPLPYSLLSQAFYTYCRKTMGLNLIKGYSNFQVLNRRIVNALINLKERKRDLRYFLCSSGQSPETFVYTPLAKAKRPSLFSRLGRSLDLLFSNSAHPLRAISWIGVAASCISLMYLVYTCLVYALLPRTAPGWTTLSLILSVMFFCFFLIIAAFSEYIGRMFTQLQGRPQYTVVRELASSANLTTQIKKNIVHASR